MPLKKNAFGNLICIFQKINLRCHPYGEICPTRNIYLL